MNDRFLVVKTLHKHQSRQRRADNVCAAAAESSHELSDAAAAFPDGR